MLGFRAFSILFFRLQHSFVSSSTKSLSISSPLAVPFRSDVYRRRRKISLLRLSLSLSIWDIWAGGFSLSRYLQLYDTSWFTVLLLQEDDQGSSTTAVKIQVRGLQGWSVWDDGVYSTVKGIRINHDEDYIRSSQIEYIDKDGEPTWGCPHGDDTDRSTSTTVA